MGRTAPILMPQHTRPELVYAQAQEADAEGIQHVAGESWRATYKDIYSPEYIAEFVARAYSIEGLVRAVRNPRSVFLVAKDGTGVVGFCHYGEGPQGPELLRMYVLPDYWRMGTGSRFLQLLESRLVERGVSEYFCYVHARNEIGKAFYVKYGFVPDAAHDKDDEWCMRRALARPGGNARPGGHIP